MKSRPIRTLLFSSLYPSSARPVHGVFVETRLRELLKSGRVETKVVAPVPWFPFTAGVFGEYASLAATPKFEVRNHLEVHHPRYFLPPKIGMTVAPYLMAASARPVIQKIIDDGFDFDLIDAHYYYPDGVAASILAKQLNKPFVVTARGTDLNLITDFALPRRLILETAAKAAGSIGVCKALMDRLEELGGQPEKLHVLRNGVDLQRFVPENKADARKKIGFDSVHKMILSVGHLIDRKGHAIAIAGMHDLPDCHLAIIGKGPDEGALRQLATKLGVSDRVQFVGQIPNEELKWWYSAADALVLCSSREGWANVLLESMACGTPVVATNIWGTPEVVSSPVAGLLMDERTPNSMVASLRRLLAEPPARSQTRAYAEQFSWEATTNGQLRLFEAAIGTRGEN